MSAKIKGKNYPPEWSHWTIELAPPVSFVITEAINQPIIIELTPGGARIQEIRVFSDISGPPAFTFTSNVSLEDGKQYTYDFEQRQMIETIPIWRPLLIIAAVLGSAFLLIRKKK